jgi:hypothetical protein
VNDVKYKEDLTPQLPEPAKPVYIELDKPWVDETPKEHPKLNNFLNWLKGLIKPKSREQVSSVSPREALEMMGGNPFQSTPRPPPASAILFTADNARDLRNKEELSLLEVQTIIDAIRVQAQNRNAPKSIVVDQLSALMQEHFKMQGFQLSKGHKWVISW